MQTSCILPCICFNRDKTKMIKEEMKWSKQDVAQFQTHNKDCWYIKSYGNDIIVMSLCYYWNFVHIALHYLNKCQPLFLCESFQQILRKKLWSTQRSAKIYTHTPYCTQYTIYHTHTRARTLHTLELQFYSVSSQWRCSLN